MRSVRISRRGLRLFSALLAALMLLGALPLLRVEARATGIADSEVFLKQEAGQRRCTLVSALMMIRRKLILQGDANWASLTEQSAKADLWGSSGLPWSFTYAGVSVKTYGMKSDLGLTSAAEKKAYFLSALETHPEGIVIYNHSYPHAVLLTRYDAGTDTLCCADPAGSSRGEIPLADCTIPGSTQDAVIGNINQIWIVTGSDGSGAPAASEPPLLGRGYSMTVNVGAGSTLRFCSSWSSSSASLGSIPNGSEVYVYGVTESEYDSRRWAKISWNGRDGWVNYAWLANGGAAAQTYTVRFDANGGEGAPAALTKTQGQALTLPQTVPTRYGYEFFGWAEHPNRTEAEYSPGDAFTDDADTVLYALWIRRSFEISVGSNGFELTAGGDPVTTWFHYAESWMRDPQLLCYCRDESVAYVRYDTAARRLTITPLRAGSTTLVLCSLDGDTELDRVELPVRVAEAPVPAGLLNFRYSRPYDGRFLDVADSDWFYSNVAAAYSLSLMQGRSADCFAVDGTLSTAEAVTIAARLNAIYFTGGEQFDAPAAGEAWYAPYVRYAGEADILPSDAGDWDFDAPVDRSRFAQILANALPAEALPAVNRVSDGSIPDVSMTLRAAPAVYALYRAGILAGSDAAGSFLPDNTITRKEAAAIITRLADPALRQDITLL